MRKEWQRRTIGIAACVLCVGCVYMSVLAGEAADADGPVSNVWLSVVELPTQARISVTLPTSYGFAVVGSVEDGDNGPVTSDNGKVLLSNVRVEVTEPSTLATPGQYRINTVGLPQLSLENYSTDVRGEHAAEENPEREGLPVEVRPYIIEIPEALLNGVTQTHHWKPIEIDPTGDQTLFKRYRMGIGKKWLDTLGSVIAEGKTVPAYFMGGSLELPAPPDVPGNGWTAGGLAKAPSISAFDVDVQVGGVQNQYTQVEQSLKVGEIGWQITPGTLP